MKMKLKTGMKGLFLGTFLPLLIVIILSIIMIFSLSSKIMTRYVIAESEKSVSRLCGQISDYLAPAIINIDDFTNISKNNLDKESMDALVHGFAENIPYSESFYYSTVTSRFEEGGYYVDSSDWTPPDDWLPPNRGWYIGAVEKKGQLHFEEPYIDEMTGGLCISVSKQVFDKNKNFMGVVSIDLLIKDLAKMVESVYLSENGKINLVSNKGIYLTNKDPEKVTKANYFEESKVPYAAEEYLNGVEKGFLHEGRYYAVSKISSTPWFIVAEGPVGDFTKRFMRLVILSAIFILIFGLLSSFINIKTVRKARSGEHKLGKRIFSETQTLVESSKNNALTAQNQNVAVKEIVATMEDNTALSEDISQKIKDVSGIAVKTSEDVSEGVSYIEDNVLQLQAIALTNEGTITGIKALGEKISNIWDIVTLINSVADQAKIIAFNAELEASSAGEAGRNFHIVATEIRRLADGIIDGTKEIKEKITEIQQSSDSLILASEDGTEKIQTGVVNAKNLEERFASIKAASEVTAESAGKITTIIQQQTVASEQILITLKQIATGVERFTEATEHISNASQNLKEIAMELGSANDSENDLTDKKAIKKSEK
ncbi:MAG: hypothetical protein K5873_12465 [Treponema sp.]|nr:hypothetical protein [Treponema sp.]